MGKIQLLGHTDHTQAKAYQLGIGKSDPLPPADEGQAILLPGQFAMAHRDMFYHRDDTWHGLTLNDTEQIAINTIDNTNLALNKWYYGTHANALCSDVAANCHLYACNSTEQYIAIKPHCKIMTNPNDNEFSIDFSLLINRPLTFVVEQSTDKTSWSEVYRKDLSLFIGELRLDTDVMLRPSSHIYYRFMIEAGAYPSQEIGITGHQSSFEFAVPVYRKPRLSWKQKFVIPYTLNPALGSAIFEFPGSGLELPYQGIYEVNAFVTTKESDMFDVFVNSDSPQELNLSGNGGSYFSIDVGGTLSDSAGAPTVMFTPNSLQGSSFVEITEGKVYLQVILPNGFKREVQSGYLDIRFVGDMYSPCLETV